MRAEKSYLYLLLDKTPGANRFKIGYSTDPYLRQLGFPQNIDLQNSVQYGCATEDVHRIERLLHFMFRVSRLNGADLGGGDGATEWFSLDCLKEVKDYLTVYAARLGVDVPISIRELKEVRVTKEGRVVTPGRKGKVIAWTDDTTREVLDVIGNAVALLQQVTPVRRFEQQGDEFVFHISPAYDHLTLLQGKIRKTFLVMPAPRWGTVQLIRIVSNRMKGLQTFMALSGSVLTDFMASRIPTVADRDFDQVKIQAYETQLLPAIGRYKETLDALINSAALI